MLMLYKPACPGAIYSNGPARSIISYVLGTEHEQNVKVVRQVSARGITKKKTPIPSKKLKNQ
jgi:hypothetical protein